MLSLSPAPECDPYGVVTWDPIQTIFETGPVDQAFTREQIPRSAYIGALGGGTQKQSRDWSQVSSQSDNCRHRLLFIPVSLRLLALTDPSVPYRFFTIEKSGDGYISRRRINLA